MQGAKLAGGLGPFKIHGGPSPAGLEPGVPAAPCIRGRASYCSQAAQGPVSGHQTSFTLTPTSAAMDQQANQRENALDECDRTRRHAQEYLDGELEESVASAIMLHVQICPPCGRRITFEAAFLRSLSRADGSAPLPPSIEERVAVLLTEWRRRNA